MSYLVSQIFLCLLAAALAGFVFGWLLKGLACRKKLRQLVAEAEKHKVRHYLVPEDNQHANTSETIDQAAQPLKPGQDRLARDVDDDAGSDQAQFQQDLEQALQASGMPPRPEDPALKG